MLDPKKLDELASKLSEAVPPAAKSLQADLEKQFKQIMQAGIAKLDLVTREEFDVQTKVLARTRARLDEMEKVVKAMEEKYLKD